MRLVEGRGFAAFGTADFTAGVVEQYLSEDRGVEHLVLVHHADTDPTIAARIDTACADRRVAFRPVAWAEYGAPENVAAVATLPPGSLAIVSADHHKSVRDRMDVRRGYIRRKTARKKIVLDTIPYEVAPWRIFFPFAFFDRDMLGYHHSYALEQDHEKFLDGLAENPCAVDRIASRTWRASVVTGEPLFRRRPELVELSASAADRTEYARVRDHLFATEKSITGVKNKLARWIQERYPRRSIPTDLKRVYAADFTRIVATDLPFDRWLCSEIRTLMDHTDELLCRWAELAREAP